jgi:uncharacterized membrane protein
MTTRRAWPLALLASCGAVAITTSGIGPSAIQALVALWFLVVCPGAALVRLLPPRNAFTGLVLAVATSVALEAALATLLLEAKAWSPNAVLALLVAVTAAASVVDLVGLPRRREAQ